MKLVIGIAFLLLSFQHSAKAQLHWKNSSFEALDYVPNLTNFQYYIPNWTYCENVPYIKGKFFKWYSDTSIYTPPSVYGNATEGHFFIAMIARNYWVEDGTILYPDAIRETISTSLKCSNLLKGHHYILSVDVRRVEDFLYGNPYIYLYFGKDTCDTTNIVYEDYVRDTAWKKTQFTFEAKDSWNHLSIRCRHMYKDTSTFISREAVQMYLDNLSPVTPDTAYNSEHFPIIITAKGLSVYSLRSPYNGQEQYWYEGNKLLGSGDSIAVSNTSTYRLTLGKDSCIPSVLQTTITVPSDTVTGIKSLLFFPNAFTPNGDASNAIFRVIQNANLASLQSYELSVYNRWGQRIWQSKDYSQGWDGSNAAIGVYYWLCSYTLANGSRQVQKGDVSLLR